MADYLVEKTSSLSSKEYDNEKRLKGLLMKNICIAVIIFAESIAAQDINLTGYTLSFEDSARLLGDGCFWRDVEQPEPLVSRMADVLANRVDRLKAISNGQVPAVAALAWRILNGLD